MPILYSPDDEPRQIPDGEIKQWLKQGYRQSLNAAPIAEALDATANASLINLNEASLKDLIALPHVGTALAKKIQGARPFANLEDARNKLPEVDWTALESRVFFTPSP